MSFYTPLQCVLERHIVASFPHVSIRKAVDLLHNPEHWGMGACIAFGVPRFKITNISQVICFNLRFGMPQLKNHQCIPGSTF